MLKAAAMFFGIDGRVPGGDSGTKPAATGSHLPPCLSPETDPRIGYTGDATAAATRSSVAAFADWIDAL